jgi:hypothetical protein
VAIFGRVTTHDDELVKQEHLALREPKAAREAREYPSKVAREHTALKALAVVGLNPKALKVLLK